MRYHLDIKSTVMILVQAMKDSDYTYNMQHKEQDIGFGDHDDGDDTKDIEQ